MSEATSQRERLQIVLLTLLRPFVDTASLVLFVAKSPLSLYLGVRCLLGKETRSIGVSLLKAVPVLIVKHLVSIFLGLVSIPVVVPLAGFTALAQSVGLGSAALAVSVSITSGAVIALTDLSLYDTLAVSAVASAVVASVIYVTVATLSMKGGPDAE